MRVLAGGPIHTLVEGAPPCEAIAFDGGTIVAVGSRAEVAARAPNTTPIELAGRAVVPGFIDAHHHMCMVALYASGVRCSADEVATHDDIVRRLAAAAATLPEGAWLVGYDYDARRLPGNRHPTRDQLDAACRDRPVLLLHYSHHEAIASSLALRLVGIDRDTPDPPGGEIVRDKRGEPTGRLIEAAMGRCERLARDSLAARHADDWIRHALAHEARLFAAGITRIHDPIVHAPMEALYHRARNAGLRIPIISSPLAAGGFLEADDRITTTASGEGTATHRTGPIKMTLDGAERCAMCLSFGQLARSAIATVGTVIRRFTLAPVRAGLDAPFSRGPDGKLHRGLLFYDREAATRSAGSAVDRGYDLMIHAIGNEAVDVALDAIAAHRTPGRFPPRIEHATFTSPAQRARMADLGVVASTQATFLAVPDMATAPPIAGIQMLPLRSMLDAGLVLALSSDHPVTHFDPLHGMRCAVTRRLFGGRVHDPDEAIDAAQALAGYTRNAAFATGSLAECGTLEVGKRADLVILSGDPLAHGALERVSVVETVLGGETVFDRNLQR